MYGSSIRASSPIVLRKDIGISSESQFIIIGSRGGYTAFIKDPDYPIIRAACGCFDGSIEEFESRVQQVHGRSEHDMAYLKTIEYAKNLLL